MKQEKQYDIDLVVIGGGCIGLSTALSAAKMGKSVVVLEKFDFGNQNGSSAGHVRMWRTAITERSHAEMTFEAGKMYRDIELESGNKILYKNGLLNFGVETDYTEQGTIETACSVLEDLGRKSVRYTKKQLEERFPFKNLPDNYFGVYHEDNATINVKVFMGTMVDLNKRYGVELKSKETVHEIKSESNGVVITSDESTYYAKKAVVCPGAYSNELLKQFGFQLNFLFWDMPFAYYKITDSSLTFPMWFQFDHAKDDSYSKLFYGFPPVKFGREGFVRLAVDWASHKFTDISERKFVPRDLDIELTRQYIEDHMRGVSSMPIDMTSAIQAQLPDNLSVLDYLPKEYVEHNKNIVLFAGGWAFKAAPLFGKACAEFAFEGGSEYDVSELSINRKDIIKR